MPVFSHVLSFHIPSKRPSPLDLMHDSDIWSYGVHLFRPVRPVFLRISQRLIFRSGKWPSVRLARWTRFGRHQSLIPHSTGGLRAFISAHTSYTPKRVCDPVSTTRIFHFRPSRMSTNIPSLSLVDNHLFQTRTRYLKLAPSQS